ncbi:MAG: hypothetical protein KBH24_07870, partial [Brachymonas sp.]|nr:hypothetical protein [Brachymonas sp.]
SHISTQQNPNAKSTSHQSPVTSHKSQVTSRKSQPATCNLHIKFVIPAQAGIYGGVLCGNGASQVPCLLRLK